MRTVYPLLCEDYFELIISSQPPPLLASVVEVFDQLWKMSFGKNDELAS